MLDQGLEQREVAQLLDGLPEARQREGERIAVLGQLRPEIGRLRQRGAGRIDPRLCRLIGDRGRADLEVEREGAFLGDADFFADQPGRVRLEGKALARLCAFGNGDLHRQQHGIAEAEIDERLDRERLWRRPLDRTGVEACGQCPRDPRRLAGIAGIGPVGVPALGDLLAERDLEALAGRNDVAAGEQGRSDAGAGDRSRFGGKGGAGQEQCEDEKAPPQQAVCNALDHVFRHQIVKASAHLPQIGAARQ